MDRITYQVCLFLDNDATAYTHWRKEAQRILTHYQSNMPPFSLTPFQAARMDMVDMLRAEYVAPSIGGLFGEVLLAALALVDWREVATSRFDEDWEGVE